MIVFQALKQVCKTFEYNFQEDFDYYDVEDDDDEININSKPILIQNENDYNVIDRFDGNV